MDQQFSQLIEYIKTSKLGQEEKTALLAKLENTTLSHEEQERFLADFLKEQAGAIREEKASLIKTIDDEAEEMKDAQEEYEKAMAEIEREMNDTAASLQKEMDAVQVE